jgi:hypothetical protein
MSCGNVSQIRFSLILLNQGEETFAFDPRRPLNNSIDRTVLLLGIHVQG